MKSNSLFLSLSVLCWSSTVTAACYDPSPAFPPPTYKSSDPILLDAFSRVQDSLTSLISLPKYNTTSFSIQVTSTQDTLWSSFHTARELNTTRPGTPEVRGDSAYRIASITKTFTTLALLQLHKAGWLSLDNPVNYYLPDLKGDLPWKDITLRILASQLSGIPRDWSGGDLVASIPNAWRYGLPPPQRDNPDLPECYNYDHYHQPCTEPDLYRATKHTKPVFAPNAVSTYSNMAFEILGLVITHVSGIKYEDYIQTKVLDVIGMHHSSFNVPPDSVAVLPKGSAWFWDVDEGIHNPTGGLYSTADDLSIYLRYILRHYNALTTGVNWLQPHSFAFGSESFYGMPWEIFRTTKLLENGRPVSFFTKSGGEPGYVSIIMAVPEYGLGFTILVAGSDETNGALLDQLRELVTVPIIRAAEEVAKREVEEKYVGKYIFDKGLEENLNTSLRLTYSETEGLVLTDWISNGTEVLKAFSQFQPSWRDREMKMQLIPTLLYVDEEKQKGEKWRALILPPKKDKNERGVWDGFCITDVDILMYDGVPINEGIMWVGDGGKVEEVEMSAFRVKLKRQEKDEELFVQEL